jgi:hypothetical protein
MTLQKLNVKNLALLLLLVVLEFRNSNAAKFLRKFVPVVLLISGCAQQKPIEQPKYQLQGRRTVPSRI